MTIAMEGSMPASSHASRELSTASLTVVSKALRGLSNPRRWRFFAKNSETEISRCLVAIVSALERVPPDDAILIESFAVMSVATALMRPPWPTNASSVPIRMRQNPNKSAAGSVPLDHAGYADKAVGSEEAFE